MDRKSFFKRAFLAIGTAIVPSVLLQAVKKNNRYRFIEGFCQPDNGPATITSQDGETTLYWQMQSFFEQNRNRVVKADKFYWAEYNSDNGLKIFDGPKADPMPVTFTLCKKA